MSENCCRSARGLHKVLGGRFALYALRQAKDKNDLLDMMNAPTTDGADDAPCVLLIADVTGRVTLVLQRTVPRGICKNEADVWVPGLCIEKTDPPEFVETMPLDLVDELHLTQRIPGVVHGMHDWRGFDRLEQRTRYEPEAPIFPCAEHAGARRLRFFVYQKA